MGVQANGAEQMLACVTPSIAYFAAWLSIALHLAEHLAFLLDMPVHHISRCLDQVEVIVSSPGLVDHDRELTRGATVEG